MSIISVDLANGSVKIVSSTYQDCYPNRLQRLYGMEFNHFDTETVTYKYNNKEFIINNKGLTSGGRNSNRYFTEEYLIELLIAISKATTDEKNDIVLLLPCEDYKNKKIIAQIKETLLGRYELKVNGISRIIYINSIRVIAQPFGTLIHYLINSDGEFIDDRNKFTYALIDIGQSTTDIIVTDGIKLEKIEGFNIGCMDITNRFLNLVNNSRTDIKLTRNDVSKTFNPIIKKYDEVFNFTDEMNNAKLITVEEIKTSINDSGIDLLSVDRCIYCGGGSMLLKGYLIKNRNEKLYPSAQMSNAKGGYIYGRVRCNG